MDISEFDTYHPLEHSCTLSTPTMIKALPDRSSLSQLENVPSHYKNSSEATWGIDPASKPPRSQLSLDVSEQDGFTGAPPCNLESPKNLMCPRPKNHCKPTTLCPRPIDWELFEKKKENLHNNCKLFALSYNILIYKRGAQMGWELKVFNFSIHHLQCAS